VVPIDSIDFHVWKLESLTLILAIAPMRRAGNCSFDQSQESSVAGRRSRLWNADYPTEKRNADKSVNQNENVDRCFACHKSQAQRDFVWTFDRMMSANQASSEPSYF
jgi:hypothetical protein